jgi:hypothetical protein
VYASSHIPANSETMTELAVSSTTTSGGSPPMKIEEPPSPARSSTGLGSCDPMNAISCSKRSGAVTSEAAGRMLTITSQLGALAFLLAVLAAIFPVLSAFGHHAAAGGVGAFCDISHGDLLLATLRPTERVGKGRKKQV